MAEVPSSPRDEPRVSSFPFVLAITRFEVEFVTLIVFVKTLKYFFLEMRMTTLFSLNKSQQWDVQVAT